MMANDIGIPEPDDILDVIDLYFLKKNPDEFRWKRWKIAFHFPIEGNLIFKHLKLNLLEISGLPVYLKKILMPCPIKLRESFCKGWGLNHLIE